MVLIKASVNRTKAGWASLRGASDESGVPVAGPVFVAACSLVERDAELEMPTEPMGRARTRPGDPAHTTGKNCSKGPLSIDYIPEKPEVNEVLSPKPDDRGVFSTGYGRLYYFYEVRLLQPSTVENLGTSWQAPVGRQRLRWKPEPGHPGFKSAGWMVLAAAIAAPAAEAKHI